MRNIETYIGIGVVILFVSMAIYNLYLGIKEAILKEDQRTKLRLFHNAVVSIHGKKLQINEVFSQLNLNYKMIQLSIGDGEDNSSILEVLESMIFLYDSYNDKNFKKELETDKNPQIRDFLIEAREYVRKNNPFLSSPPKEAELMRTINEALTNNNPALGQTALFQLATEVENKQKSLEKKEKENRKANSKGTVLNVVGIMLTIVFGLIPFLLK